MPVSLILAVTAAADGAEADRDSEGFEHGTGYLDPHAYRDRWMARSSSG
jgi:hypothetical protein